MHYYEIKKVIKLSDGLFHNKNDRQEKVKTILNKFLEDDKYSKMIIEIVPIFTGKMFEKVSFWVIFRGEQKEEEKAEVEEEFKKFIK